MAPWLHYFRRYWIDEGIHPKGEPWFVAGNADKSLAETDHDGLDEIVQDPDKLDEWIDTNPEALVSFPHTSQKKVVFLHSFWVNNEYVFGLRGFSDGAPVVAIEKEVFVRGLVSPTKDGDIKKVVVPGIRDMMTCTSIQELMGLDLPLQDKDGKTRGRCLGEAFIHRPMALSWSPMTLSNARGEDGAAELISLANADSLLWLLVQKAYVSIERKILKHGDVQDLWGRHAQSLWLIARGLKEKPKFKLPDDKDMAEVGAMSVGLAKRLQEFVENPDMFKTGEGSKTEKADRDVPTDQTQEGSEAGKEAEKQRKDSKRSSEPKAASDKEVPKKGSDRSDRPTAENDKTQGKKRKTARVAKLDESPKKRRKEVKEPGGDPEQKEDLGQSPKKRRKEMGEPAENEDKGSESAKGNPDAPPEDISRKVSKEGPDSDPSDSSSSSSSSSSESDTDESGNSEEESVDESFDNDSVSRAPRADGTTTALGEGDRISTKRLLAEVMGKFTDTQLWQMKKDRTKKSALRNWGRTQLRLLQVLTSDGFTEDELPRINNFVKDLCLEGKNLNRAFNLIREEAETKGWDCRLSENALTYFLAKGLSNDDVLDSPQGISTFAFIPTDRVDRKTKKERKRQLQEAFGDGKLSDDTLSDLAENHLNLPTDMHEAIEQIDSMVSFLKLITRKRGDCVAIRVFKEAKSFMNRNKRNIKRAVKKDPSFLVRMMFLIDRCWQDYLTKLVKFSKGKKGLKGPRDRLSNHASRFLERELFSLESGGAIPELSLPRRLESLEDDLRKGHRERVEEEGPAAGRRHKKEGADGWKSKNPSPKSEWAIPTGKKFADFFGGDLASNLRGFPKLRHHSTGKPAWMCVNYQVEGRCSWGVRCRMAHVKPKDIQGDDVDKIDKRLQQIYKNPAEAAGKE